MKNIWEARTVRTIKEYDSNESKPYWGGMEELEPSEEGKSERFYSEIWKEAVNKLSAARWLN